jgi:hypothetical protein
LLTKDVEDGPGSEVELVEQELVRVDGLDV